jgi:hypothetical protein
MRRASHEALNKTRVNDYHNIQTKEAVRLTDDLLRSPADWESHFKRRVFFWHRVLTTSMNDFPEWLRQLFSRFFMTSHRWHQSMIRLWGELSNTAEPSVKLRVLDNISLNFSRG